MLKGVGSRLFLILINKYEKPWKQTFTEKVGEARA